MDKSIETKRQIIEATKALVKVKPNLTVKDICSKAYVNNASINYHFGDKRNLMNIVLKEMIDEFKAYFIEQLEKNDDLGVEETIELIITIVYKFSMNNKGMIRYLFSSDENGISQENVGILQNFLFKDAFFDTVMKKLIKQTKDTDINVIYAKYMVLFSSMCLPMVIEYTSQNSEPTLSKDLMKEYVKLLEKVMMA